MAYSYVVLEKHDYARVDKIIAGIEKGTITKNNLYAEVKKLCKNVKSDHSIHRWMCITDWFYKVDWC